MATLNSYSAEQVQSLIEEIFEVRKENLSLRRSLDEANIARRSAEKKYNDMCSRAMTVYVERKSIPVLTVKAEVSCPATMIREEFETGLLKTLVSELETARTRESYNFNANYVGSKGSRR